MTNKTPSVLSEHELAVLRSAPMDYEPLGFVRGRGSTQRLELLGLVTTAVAPTPGQSGPVIQMTRYWRLTERGLAAISA